MVPNNLDAQVTAFIGRRDELTALGSLVRSARLLTLTGAGGCGKSRLAAELCRRAAAGDPRDSPWPDGIWWIDLGSTTGEADLARICAKLLEVPVEPDTDALTALTRRPAGRRLLLCLDTCEHVLDEAAGFVAGILRSCPAVQVVTTTREPLAVEGEHVWRVPSMTSEDAKNLFLDRACLVAEPAASWRDGAEVPAICDRVDRLPLAIELAAAWTRVLSPAQLRTDLDDRFRLLTGGSRRGVARHQALQASMTWSHNLLEPAEQVIFRRLAVFAGWFPLDGAVTVVADPGTGADDVLTGLARLIDKSLLVAQDRGGEVRYRLLDTVRQFAEDRLSSTDEQAAIRDRHLAWCLACAERIDRGLGEDPARAFELHHRALATRREAGIRTFLPNSLEALCALLADDRPSAQTVRILAACTSAREAMGCRRSRPAAATHDRVVERLKAALGEAFAPAWQDGTALSLDDAVELITRGRGPRDRPETGWAALTRVELEVARLVVEGLTNPEIGRRLFLSRSTVKAHLSRVYAKLAVSNRAELAAVVSRQQD